MVRIALCALIFLCSCSTARQEPPSAFVDGYFASYFAFHPSQATPLGLHEYDSRMEDYSAAAFDKRIADLKSQLTRVLALRASRLSADDAIDLSIIEGQIRSELLDIETLALWRKNPMDYIGAPGSALDGLMKRDFAPAPERLKAVIARLKGVPALMDAMRANVAHPPKEYVEFAARMAAGSVGFFKDSLGAWGKNAAGSDAQLAAEFAKVNDAAAAAVASAAEWLKKDLMPEADGAYAIGAENFSKKLSWEDMVDVPLDKVLAIGEANLEKDYQAFLETAHKIDAARKPAEVMKSLSADHPDAAHLLDATKATLENIRDYVIEKGIVDLPTRRLPIVMETPPFARNGSYASMDTPGAFETKATEAFYYVTPVEKDWDAKHAEEHLRVFNKPVMNIITIHEAFPGHYGQFLFASHWPTKTRKIVWANTNVEGWAHYTEQMMVDEGFGGGDPKLRLSQLSEALLRDCRYVAGIKLHTQGMSVAEGTKMFVDRCFQEEATGRAETMRGTYNPTYLYYTLGKLQIMKLREDYKRAKGSAFRLGEFHAAFLKQGGPPIKVVRRILLPGDDGPVL